MSLFVAAQSLFGSILTFLLFLFALRFSRVAFFTVVILSNPSPLSVTSAEEIVEGGASVVG